MRTAVPLPIRQISCQLLLAAIVLLLAAADVAASSWERTPDGGRIAPADEFNSPKVPLDHRHMRLLLANAFRYLDPVHGILDPKSGYLAEGWNQEPERGLFLRSFTQLTAIGVWVELLANVAAGYADNPYYSRGEALAALARTLETLLADQQDPALAAKGLLANFLALEGGRRQGPLRDSIERSRFVEAFGARDGEAIWRALVTEGWLVEEDAGRRGRIRRGVGYGANHFAGALAPFAAEPVRSAVMRLLDQRVVTIIFGDNANLTASLAKAEGALLREGLRQDPRAAQLRAKIGRFIEGQRVGYQHLFDPATGTFVFGWDATADRFVGWDDGRGNWVVGQMNYLINEFRGPLTFVALRYGLPDAAIANAGIQIKPYLYEDGRTSYLPAAWDGSAFQLLGLSLFMQEDETLGWRTSLAALVDAALDYSDRNGLPGLLSEAYSGVGTEYTGRIGIPALAVVDDGRIVDAPSLYTLGVAYAIAPAKVEGFLARHWPMISALFTPHGPWEGWRTSTGEIIAYQTTAHTLSLILGGIGSAQDNMRRYLAAHGLAGRLAALRRSGEAVNLLTGGDEQIRGWTSEQGSVESSREMGRCGFATHLAGSGGLVFAVPGERPASLANGTLVIHYCATAPQDVAIRLQRAGDGPFPPPAMPVEISARLERTEVGEISVVLPATPALHHIDAIALTFRGDGRTPVDVAVTGLHFIPFAPAAARR